MPLPSWSLPFKEPRTEIKRVNNAFYKYEVRYLYDPTRKRSVKKTVRLLGKITEKDGFIPSRKNQLRETLAAVPKVGIKTYGLYALFSTRLPKEAAALTSTLGTETAETLLAFALFRFAYQSPIKRAAHYHVHDFASECWSASAALSDRTVSLALKTAGENREVVIRFFKTLLPEQEGSGENFILMDSTHLMSASEQMGINAKGYTPSFDFGKQIR
jgi:hypothetical protein